MCTDGGLASYGNRKNDSVGDRSFITVQSLKKLEAGLQDWAMETKGWRIVNFDVKKGPAMSGEEYVPAYTRTDLTNSLHGSAGFRTDTRIVTKQMMKKIIKSTKNDKN